jgi:hypothetical protein
VHALPHRMDGGDPELHQPGTKSVFSRTLRGSSIDGPWPSRCRAVKRLPARDRPDRASPGSAHHRRGAHDPRHDLSWVGDVDHRPAGQRSDASLRLTLAHCPRFTQSYELLHGPVPGVRDGFASDIRTSAMDSGVPAQCSRSRCLARWTSGSLVMAAEAQQVERTQRKTCSRAESEFLCPSGFPGVRDWVRDPACPDRGRCTWRPGGSRARPRFRVA